MALGSPDTPARAGRGCVEDFADHVVQGIAEARRVGKKRDLLQRLAQGCDRLARADDGDLKSCFSATTRPNVDAHEVEIAVARSFSDASPSLFGPIQLGAVVERLSVLAGVWFIARHM